MAASRCPGADNARDGKVALQEARASAEARSDDIVLFDTIQALSVAPQRGASAPSDALRHALAGFVVAERLSPVVLARTHSLLGSPMGTLGTRDRAIEPCTAANRVAEEAGLPASEYLTGRLAHGSTSAAVSVSSWRIGHSNCAAAWRWGSSRLARGVRGPVDVSWV
jgi:hypothetical protein